MILCKFLLEIFLGVVQRTFLNGTRRKFLQEMIVNCPAQDRGTSYVKFRFCSMVIFINDAKHGCSKEF